MACRSESYYLQNQIRLRELSGYGDVCDENETYVNDAFQRLKRFLRPKRKPKKDKLISFFVKRNIIL